MLQPTYSFEELKMGSQLVRDLVQEKDTVKPLVNEFFDHENFEKLASKKTFSSEKRQILCDALKRQYEGFNLHQKTSENIEALKNNHTFTITTGHQLNLMSGPLYSIYKIAQCVAHADELNKRNANLNFVPVFWIATEDHDFEEINHIHLFGKKIAWEKSDQENVIAGRIKTDHIEPFLAAIEEKFQDPLALKVIQQFTSTYRDTENLADATRMLVNQLFGNVGLVILDGDDPKLKKLFQPIMLQEIEGEVGYQSVMKTNEYLEKNNYHEQVFVRASNLFYIASDGTRKRVRKENDQFYLEDDKIETTALIQMIQDHPEQFSPNALYRPMYQETILPNLAYIGGGGEIAYWLQLKALFDAHQVDFPMLRLRDSVLLHRKDQAELMKEFKLELMDLKLGVDQIVKDIALEESEQDLQLTEAQSDLFKAKSKVLEKVYEVNKNLETMVEAEFTKMIKSIERIESKLVKAEKSKHEQVQKKLVKLRDQFFPENGFQERYENFLPYYLKDDDFIIKILSNLKPEKVPQVRTVEI